jgi:hypothetical protein
MSFTVQKWDNNTAEIAYKLYAFDTDFIIEKEVLTGTSTESTYYNSNVSRETIAAAWTARASKTYNYALKENLVDNRFNRNFLALENSYSCSLVDAARKGVNIKVEDFPLLWIEGNDGAGYYDTYTGDTFQITGNGCVYSGSVADYAAVVDFIIQNNTDITTALTYKLLRKFVRLNRLFVDDTSISVIDPTSNLLLTEIRIKNTLIESINLLNNTELISFGADNCLVTSYDFSNNSKLTYLDLRRSLVSSLDISNLTALTDFLGFDSNNLTSFDASGLTALINCNLSSFDSLTSVNFTNCTALRILDISSDLITSVDLSTNTALVSFTARSTDLTALSITNNTALTTLIIGNSTSITSIDISNNTLLTDVDLRAGFTEAANDDILDKLNGFGLSNGVCKLRGTLSATGAAEKSALQGKGWSVLIG